MVCSKISQHQPHVLICSGNLPNLFQFVEKFSRNMSIDKLKIIKADSNIARFGSPEKVEF